MNLRAQITDAMKRPKAAVDYAAGKPEANCGICVYYDRHLCQKVRGVINPDMWCKLFELK